MEAKEFNERMVASIPEMAGPYKAAIEWWMDDEPGPTVLVEDDLMPLVYKALDDEDEAFLAKFALWMEDMVSLKDELTRSTIYVCVFEKAFYEGRIEGLKPYFLKASKEMYEGTSFAKK